MSENEKGDGALVRLAAVEKVFHRGAEDIHVLADLNMQVSAREFLALMGPSGSGKTTLLNLIGGLDRPTKGSVSTCFFRSALDRCVSSSGNSTLRSAFSTGMRL